MSTGEPTEVLVSWKWEGGKEKETIFAEDRMCKGPDARKKWLIERMVNRSG